MQVPAQDVTVHIPAEAVDTGYEIVAVDITSVPSNGLVNITVNAPTGKKVIGGGFMLSNSGGNNYVGIQIDGTRLQLHQNGPASDGSYWKFSAELVPSGTSPYGTVYAICISV